MSDLDAPGYMHVIPINDLREHDEHGACWCRPTIYHDDAIVVHNSMDRREEYERGRKVH